MNKLTRILAMGGFGVLAALATSAGPAQAATATGSAEHKPSVRHAEWLAGDEIVGYYGSRLGCELAGQYGERAGDWDEHECTLVRLGLRRGAWALQVASDNDWNRLGFGVPFRAIHGFPHQFRPAWPGVFRPGHDHFWGFRDHDRGFRGHDRDFRGHDRDHDGDHGTTGGGHTGGNTGGGHDGGHGGHGGGH